MKIGLWGARADNTGLGTQTWEFYKHMKPEKTVGLMFDYNGQITDLNRYGSEAIFTPVIDEELMRNFLKGLDIVYVAETPYNYEFFAIAREMGVKTVLNFNYEFFEYFEDSTLPEPDVFLAPSKWHIKDVEEWVAKHVPNATVEYLPFPVSLDNLEFREIWEINTLVHIAGSETLEDRNGTKTFLEAIRLMEYRPNVIVYCPKNRLLDNISDWIDLRKIEVDNYWDLFKEGDALVLPRKYGGQSLQLNEALAVGMIPVMPNIGPQNTFLHPMSLTPTDGRKEIRTKTIIDCYDITPKELAKHLDIMVTLSEEEVRTLNQVSYVTSMLFSWENLQPKYERLFNQLIEKK